MRNGHTSVMEWECAHGCTIEASELIIAVENAQVLRWVLEHVPVSDALKRDVAIILVAIDCDNMDSLKLLHAHRFAFDEYVWLHAAQRGKVEALRMLLDEIKSVFFVTPSLWRAAAMCRQRHVVQWASDRGYALDADTRLWLNVTE